MIYQTIMTSLKALATSLTWEEAEPIVVDLCYFLGENMTDEYVNVDELCPGIIALQGPHVSIGQDPCDLLNLIFKLTLFLPCLESCLIFRKMYRIMLAESVLEQIPVHVFFF